MRSYDVAIDVTGRCDLSGQLRTVVTVHLPDDPHQLEGPVTVLFGFPGGGYGRRYYDIRALPGYSQAEHHTAEGLVFVACDHLGVGDSTQPDMLALTYENLAAANHATVAAVVERLRAGTVAGGAPAVDVSTLVGMGQSMGGCLLTVQQANHGTFDGVAFLGWSGLHTNFPAKDGGRDTFPMPSRGTDLRPIADRVLGAVAPDEDQLRFCFHWPDEPPELMEVDLAAYRPFGDIVRGDDRTPWGSTSTPPCAVTMMTPGAVAAEAAAIEVPVLVGCGERDVVPDPWAEPTAYRASGDVSIFVTPRMAHMHNFADTRANLWRRISAFARSVPVRLPAKEDASAY